jgi:hypothetical protein
MTKGEQGFLKADGMEPPRNRKIEGRIAKWLELRSDARRLSAKAKQEHDLLMSDMVDEGLELYPFVDPDSKKKCCVKADKTPHAKVIRGARAKAALGGHEDTKKRKRKAKPSDDDQVESRRVPRTAEHDKAADPFASTRKALNGHHEAQ